MVDSLLLSRKLIFSLFWFCLLIGKFSVNINIFHLFYLFIIVTFPISIISYTNYNIISYTKLHVKPIHITNCSAEKNRKKIPLQSNLWRSEAVFWWISSCIVGLTQQRAEGFVSDFTEGCSVLFCTMETPVSVPAVKQWRMRLFKQHKFSLHRSVRLTFSRPVLKGCSSLLSSLASTAILSIAQANLPPHTRFPR